MESRTGYTPIPPSFFARPTLEVAPELLGHFIVFQEKVVRIVEVEAYLEHDPACHAFPLVQHPEKPRRGRRADLFAAPGLAYIYLNYGIHWLLNVITEPEGTAGAVLIRAGEPVRGLPQRPGLTSGPGKLTRALGVDGSLHLHPLDRPPLVLAFDPERPRFSTATTPRVGIRKGTEYPWRFFIRGNPWVSRPRF